MSGIAAGVETGDDKHAAVFFDDEKQRVGKAAQERAAHVLKNDRELAGILARALDDGVDRFAEAPA